MKKSRTTGARAERRLVDVSVLMQKIDGCEATVYRRIADGTLPQPLKLGHLNRWWEDQVDAALAALRPGAPVARSLPPGETKAVRKWRPGGPGRPPKSALAK